MYFTSFIASLFGIALLVIGAFSEPYGTIICCIGGLLLGWNIIDAMKPLSDKIIRLFKGKSSL